MIGQPRFDIQDHGGRMVRRAVVLDSELCDAIMDLATAHRAAWTLSEIRALNDELDACELTVAEFVSTITN